MLQKFMEKFSIEQLIRYILIGIIDVFLITLFFKLQTSCTPSKSNKIFNCFINQKNWLFLITPALGFMHYLIHRFLFFVIYDTIAYSFGLAPWASATHRKKGCWLCNCFSFRKKGCLLCNLFSSLCSFFKRLFKAICLSDHYDKADFVKFRNHNDFPKKLSDYIFWRWAAIHFIFMLLESLLLFDIFYKPKSMMSVLILIMIIVIIYGAFPLHKYEKKYYKDYIDNGRSFFKAFK